MEDNTKRYAEQTGKLTAKQHVQVIYPSAHIRYYPNAHFFKYEVWIDEAGDNWCASCASTASFAWQKASGVVDRYLLRKLEQ